MAVEEKFDIEIPDEAVENIKTIKELVNYLEANLH
jgi:acyl carrier protein